MRNLLIISTLVKALLFPAYRSTDFEVHRNWLAITHSLPISQWYYEKTSEWTLDYPPFFAWFERTLSTFAPLADPKMLEVSNLNYASDATIYFQRTTVIVSELMLFWALERYREAFGSKTVNYVIAASVFLHPGLFIVDHMHFQYNGFLYGILVLSIVEAKKGNLLLSGILFAVLLNFKHIFLYMAPAYFVYLLKAYCFQTTTVDDGGDGPSSGMPFDKKFSCQLNYNASLKPIPVSTDPLVPVSTKTTFSFLNFITLGGSVILAFLLSFGPFAYLGQVPQVFSRLFPFTRGLCHALWAPNFWALYAGADRVLIIGW
ncbi:hypothetical protein BC938DRAFT_470819 [Jimgerdemannia flammicorona]|uniref:Alpha-1,3-glucosyltransferase n=1 Tax=Jimgerdemannia flammicorona TaxID=994334 RepID=A0A433Q9H4_9FUNG|nr:hypothetical protein BC938DRAFT_470819 [Jimgerdemannia flammicorona]